MSQLAVCSHPAQSYDEDGNVWCDAEHCGRVVVLVCTCNVETCRSPCPTHGYRPMCNGCTCERLDGSPYWVPLDGTALRVARGLKMHHDPGDEDRS